MKHIILPLLLTSSALLSLPAMADCVDNTCFGKINTFAESLKVTNDGVFISIIQDIDRAALSCELDKNKLIRIPEKSKQFDSMHSLLLTAFAANADVVIELDPEEWQCQLGSVELLPIN